MRSPERGLPRLPQRTTGLALLTVLLLVGRVDVSAQSQSSVTVISNVTIVPMDREGTVAGQTVVIRNGRIAAIGPFKATPFPADAQRIDGTGRYLLPGLSDMHVHILSSDELLLYLANGVTTVRNMWGMPFHLRMRDSIRAGSLLGPTIYTGGALVDGDPPQMRGSAIVRTASDADSIVDQELRDGYDFIKIYSRLTPEAYAAVAAAAKRRGATFAGHVPVRVGIRAVLAAGQSSIEHLMGYAAASLAVDTGAVNWGRTLDPARLGALALDTRAAGTWNTPTLVVLGRLEMSAAASKDFLDRPELRFLPKATREFCCGQPFAPQNDLSPDEVARRRENRIAVVRALKAAGARLLLGTDNQNSFVPPGFSLPDELDALVQAGLSPYEALRAGTRDAAEYRGDLRNVGTIEVGKRADLVLLRSNPLENIDAVRAIVGVSLRGRWISSEELSRLLDAQAERNGSPDGAHPQSAEGVVSSTKGMVISSSAIASDVGAKILLEGGNAVDAVVATAFALAVTYPGAGNIGGGGFMVVRTAQGAASTIDYREKAPLNSSQTMFLDSAGRADTRLTATGYLAAGVPGTVRGLAAAQRRWGRLPWKRVVMPAVVLAESGFPLSNAVARWINYEVAGPMLPYRASIAAYGKPGGGQWNGGDTVVLRDLGRSLRAIAEQGADVFYTGWIADSIASAMRVNGGLISKRDLAAYQPTFRKPVRGRYRGYDIVAMPPPSSGGVTLVEMLNILENGNLSRLSRTGAAAIHHEIEAMRRGYLDRARYLGDPEFSRLPVDRLDSKAYARKLAASIDPHRATSSVTLGQDIVGTPAPSEPEQTTHISVVDAAGNAASNTFTLEGGFGSHVVAQGTGFVLNNEMNDFNMSPGVTTAAGDIGTRANLIAPGKRMLSSMSPTILSRNGKLFMVTGSPGGRTIVNTVLEVILNVVDFGMDVRAAVDAPRFHHQWLPDTTFFERNAVDDATAEQLRSMGHAVQFGGVQGDAHTIIVRGRIAYGANDRRSSDSKVSVP